jgi:replication-associated recombination protein RarA
MPNVYIHANTQLYLDSLVQELPQSIAITGPSGIGLTAVAHYIAKSMKTLPIFVLPEKDEKIDLEKGVITVDIVRRLYGMTKTIETGVRLIVIDYAERMSVQAQNAFLKLLEEPGAHTHFILLTHTPSKFIPTVKSRVQMISIAPITPTQSNELLDELHVTDTQKRTQLLFIAAGLPASMTTLANNEKLFNARAQIVRDARTYLQGSMYERLQLALAYKDDRVSALVLLVDAMKLLGTSLKSGKTPEQVYTISSLLEAHERIEANGNIRLQLAATNF